MALRSSRRIGNDGVGDGSKATSCLLQSISSTPCPGKASGHISATHTPNDLHRTAGQARHFSTFFPKFF